MRNILAYPLKPEEALSVLDSQIQAIAQSGNIGGISGYALSQVKAFLEQNEAAFSEFLARKD